jgi:hypothetical protein
MESPLPEVRTESSGTNPGGLGQATYPGVASCDRHAKSQTCLRLGLLSLGEHLSRFARPTQETAAHPHQPKKKGVAVSAGGHGARYRTPRPRSAQGRHKGADGGDA